MPELVKEDLVKKKIKINRNTFSLEDKIEILKEFDNPDASLNKISHKFKIPKSTLLGIKKNRTTLFNDFYNASSYNKQKKRKRDGKFKGVEESLFIWFNTKKNVGFNLSNS